MKHTARFSIVVAFALVTGGAVLAQTQLDGIVMRFGDDLITQSDVRQARALKLVEAGDGSDQAYVDALVNRRLILSEIRRSAVAEPANDALESRYRNWTSGLGAADVPGLLARVGMTEAGVRGWMRDDLRIQAYLDQRFTSSVSRSRDMTAWIAELRRRVGLK